MGYLEEKGLPQRRIPLPLGEFELQDGVIYHLRKLPGQVLHQLVVPRELRRQALRFARVSTTAAHPGIHQSYVKLRDHYYFPNMLREVIM